MAKKIKFVNDSIMIEVARNHYQIAGNLSNGHGVVYVYMLSSHGEYKSVARFKYKSPKTNAKDWVKFILQHYTPDQLINILHDTKETPLELARKHGYVHPNIRKYEEEKAKWRKDMESYLMRYEARPARFNETSCSQCGRTFGPGNHGFSHCDHHKYL